MLQHVIYNAKQLNPENIAVVVDQPLIEKLKCFEDIQLITQELTLGRCSQNCNEKSEKLARFKRSCCAVWRYSAHKKQHNN